MDLPEDHVVDIYYMQYDKLVAGPRPTSDCNRNKEDALEIDENNDGRVADDGVAGNKAINDDDDQGEGNN